MSQRQEILELLKNSLNHEVSCKELAMRGLFHKAASRCSELRDQGYDIRYIPSKTDSVLDAKYKLIIPEVREGQVIMDLGSLE